MLDALSLKLGREAKQYDINTITDQDLKRKLDSISQIGTSILEQEDLDKYNRITTEMEKIYSKAKVPGFKDKSKMLSLDPDITLILAESRDPEELEYYWTQWREVTGKVFSNHFLKDNWWVRTSCYMSSKFHINPSLNFLEIYLKENNCNFF